MRYRLCPPALKSHQMLFLCEDWFLVLQSHLVILCLVNLKRKSWIIRQHTFNLLAVYRGFFSRATRNLLVRKKSQKIAFLFGHRMTLNKTFHFWVASPIPSSLGPRDQKQRVLINWLTPHQSKSEVMLISKRTPPVCIPPIFIGNYTAAGNGARGAGMGQEVQAWAAVDQSLFHVELYRIVSPNF